MPLPALIVNGPNLNMLGRREPEIYGSATLEDIEADCRAHAQALGMETEFFQSNDEGALVTRIQQALDGQGKAKISGLIINAGAYTHTSVALLDALSMLPAPIIEVHLSNLYRREPFRHKSYVSMVARGVICGFGAEGYKLALNALKNMKK